MRFYLYVLAQKKRAKQHREERTSGRPASSTLARRSLAPQEQGGDACPAAQPAVPASSAFGPMETRARPTSRGRARCVSFRMGRQSEQTAAVPRAGACRLQRFVICVLQNAFIVALPFSLKPTVSGIAPAPVTPFSLQGRGFRIFLLLVAGLCGEQASGMDVCVVCAHLSLTRKGRLGGNDASLPCGARICCKCAGSTLFAPAGQKRCRAGAPDFGRVAGESCLRSGLPIRNGWQARRGNGSMPSCAP